MALIKSCKSDAKKLTDVTFLGFTSNGQSASYNNIEIGSYVSLNAHIGNDTTNPLVTSVLGMTLIDHVVSSQIGNSYSYVELYEVTASTVSFTAATNVSAFNLK